MKYLFLCFVVVNGNLCSIVLWYVWNCEEVVLFIVVGNYRHHHYHAFWKRLFWLGWGGLMGMMIRRIRGVSLKANDELLSRLGFGCVEDKIQRAKLRCFGRVEQKEENNLVKKCTWMNVIWVMGRGALRKTWRSCAKTLEAMGIKEDMAQDPCAWRNITGGPTRARADAWR